MPPILPVHSQSGWRRALRLSALLLIGELRGQRRVPCNHATSTNWVGILQLCGEPRCEINWIDD
jgi:hypothetical protein